ncbi:uncharacterized protein C2845_PM05G12060 [Panicum miliaceum]|uniref:Uncharacterized protein n=1 Tax=Panicum miliaceum TaxID=4540 RepID=A0A3L6SZ00_PANMI|nr:uncharacterized protein C2845_PM05G12060 [Panicum miliaceum]
MAPPIEGEVRIQKVEKIDLVYNLLTKPSIYAKPVAATGKYHTSGHDVTGWKKTESPGKGIVSVEDINKRSEKYITEMKKRFLG